MSFARIIFVLSFFCSVQLSAQIQLKRLETDMGMTVVRSIQRDQSGYLWIGNMGAGLMRFDGSQIRQYMRDGNAPNSLSGNTITCMLEDRTGLLWVGTTEGLNTYHPETDSFTVYRSSGEGGTSISQDSVVRILEIAGGDLWVVSEKGVNRFDRKTEAFSQFIPQLPNRGRIRFSDAVYDGEKGFWIPDIGNRVWYFDIESETWSHCEPWESERSSVKTIYRDSLGSIWIGSRTYGLFEFFPEDLRVERIASATDGSGPNVDVICDMLEYEPGKLLIAMNQGGLNEMDLETRRFSYQSIGEESSSGLSSDGALFLYRDFEDILWVGTSRSGVEFHNPYHGQFSTLRRNRYRPSNSLAFDVVGCVFEDRDGRILIGTDGGGISILDPDTGTVRTAPQDFREDPDLIQSNIIRKIDQSSDGTFWIATWDAGVFPAREEDGQFYIDQKRLAKLRTHTFGAIWDLEIDSEDRLWLTGAGMRIYLFDQELNLLIRHSEPNPKPMVSPPIVTETESGDILITGSYGIYRYENGEIRMFLKVSSPSCVVSEASTGGFIVGTGEDGVYRFDRDGNRVASFGIKEGLPSLIVRSVQLVGERELWVATYNGLARLFLDDRKHTSFFEGDGLQGNQYFVDASCKDRDGRLYFGGTNGLSYFSPRDLKVNTLLPQIHIDRFSLFGRPVDFNAAESPISMHPNEIDEIHLNWTENFFSFSFTGVTMTHPQQNSYAYMLEGLDEDWVHVNADQRTAVYTNVDPGEYLFRVKAANSDGVWSGVEKQVRMFVSPPFWRTNWFYIVCFALVAGLVYAWVWWRERRLRVEGETLTLLVEKKTEELNAHKEKLEEMVAERTSELLLEKEKAEESDRLKSQFLANLSHEVRTPLNAVVGFTSLIRDTDPDAQTRSSYLDIVGDNAKQLIQLIEDILDISIMSAGQLKIIAERFSLNPFLSSIYESYVHRFKRKSIELRLENQVYAKDFEFCADRFRLRQILDNLISNALKFTESGFVEILVRKTGGFIEFVVSDSGHGIPENEIELIFGEFVKLREDDKAARRGVGLGLAISKRLAALMNGELSVESEYGKGATFTLRLPIVNQEDDVVEAVESRSSDSTKAAVDASSATILVVEDEETNYQYLEAVLKRLNYRTVWARSGEEAISLVRNDNTFSLVMMDLKMPGMDGYEALKKIREIAPGLFVVAQTAYALEGDQKKIRAAGFDGALIKPIDRIKLIEIVQELVV